MNNNQKITSFSDITFLIVGFIVVFLYYVSSFMYVDQNEIRQAEIECNQHGGLNKYYIHFVAKKFTCIDGTQYEIREGNTPSFFFENILK